MDIIEKISTGKLGLWT